MNTILDIIKKRRSIRKYTDKSVSPEIINQLLTAAMSAPSAANQQPWHFLVVEKREQLVALSSFNSGYLPVAKAQVVIIVCGEEALAKLPQYWMQDCSAATENILLTATGLGLGSLWAGVTPGSTHQSKIKELFNMPENITPFAVVSLGYPDEEKPAADRFNKERVRYDHWQ
jgi:nitroreductase